MGYRVAVVGATGAVGREILKTLDERRFPVAEIAAVASARSVGQEVSFGDKQVLKVRNLDTFDFHRLGHRPVQPRRIGFGGPRAARRQGRAAW